MVARTNDILRDKVLAHAHYLERFKSAEIRRILAELNRNVYPELMEELTGRLSRIKAQGYDLGVESTKRLRDLVAALDEILRAGFGKAHTKLEKDLLDFAEVESKGTARLLQSVVEADLELVIPNLNALKVSILERPFSGSPLAEHFDSLTQTSQKSMRRALNTGLAAGESFEQIAGRIEGTKALKFKNGLVELTRRQAKSLVGSAVQHAGAAARAETYRENDDVIAGEVWTATLDSRTCAWCQELDGTQFEVGKGPMPPIHLGPCRCVRVPVLKSWRDLGLDVDDLPPSTRASMDGQVPEDTTYLEWLERQPAGVQDEALGPRRAALFRSGEVDRFVDDAGHLLTLPELASLYGLD